MSGQAEHPHRAPRISVPLRWPARVKLEQLAMDADMSPVQLAQLIIERTVLVTDTVRPTILLQPAPPPRPPQAGADHAP